MAGDHNLHLGRERRQQHDCPRGSSYGMWTAASRRAGEVEWHNIGCLRRRQGGLRVGATVGILEIPSANCHGNLQRLLHNARGESNNGNEVRLRTHRDARARAGF